MSGDFEEEVRRSLTRAAGEAGSSATLCRELCRRNFRPRGRQRRLTDPQVMAGVLALAVVTAAILGAALL